LAKRRARLAADNIVAPTRERQQRDRVERLDQQIADSSGAVARPYRAIDLLTIWERRGTITAEMHEAGETFRRLFASANLHPVRAVNFVAVRAAIGGDCLDPALHILAARERIWRALCAVGGIASPGGSII
jgi:hypothetical protein